MKRISAMLLLLVVVAAGVFAGGETESSGKTVVSIIHYMGEQPKRDGLAALIEGFTAANPDVDFEVTAVETTNYLTTLKTMIAAGDTPDIIFGKPKEHTDLIEAGHIADLSGASFLDNLTPGAIPSVTYEGNVYGVPIDLQTIGVYYNIELFTSLGLEIPHTWSDFIAVADALENAGYAAFAHPYKDSWTVFVDYFADEYVVRAEYPDMYESIEAGTRSFADYPHFRDVLARLQQRASYNAGDDWGTDNSTAQNMLATAQAGMYINGSWAISELVSTFPDVEIGFFPLPSYEQADKNAMPIGVDDAWMASASTDHPEIVQAFFRYITEPDSAAQWMEATKTISLSMDVEGYDFDPISQMIVDTLASGNVTNFHAPVLFSSALEDVYRNMIVEAVASGSTDFDSLISEFDKRINEVR